MPPPSWGSPTRSRWDPRAHPRLAARLHTHPDATARLLGALVVLELVVVGPEGYALTELGAFLRSDSPASRRAWARLMAGDFVWRAWGKLTECVRTGQPAFAVGDQRTSDTETFDVLFNDAAAAEVFHQAMADGTRGVAGDIIAAIDFGGVRDIVDVGGGYGELSCAALEAHPQIDGKVFDLEHARSGATHSSRGEGWRRARRSRRATCSVTRRRGPICS